MTFYTIDDLDGFWVTDLDDAPTAVGIVRSAPKVLRDGASLLARSVTYGFAVLGQQVGGASAAVNAKPDTRAEALAGFTTAVEPLVRDRRLLLTAGKGVPDEALEPLRAADPRPDSFWAHRHEAAAASILGALAATGPLEGRRLAIEHLDDVGAALAAAAAERAMRLVTVASPAGAVHDDDGLDPATVAAAYAEHGSEAPAVLAGGEPQDHATALAAEVDVLAVGSKAGVVDHVVATQMTTAVVVATGAAPVTARGLALLRKAGTEVLPDFVCCSGALAAMGLDPTDPPPAEPSDLLVGVAERAERIIAEARHHAEGTYLGACEAAETYLSTWRQELPFGRPLA
ncbi:MAG: hypothetical protein JJU45_16650 [Acidimicrobiia bacterium]|nr:hypothetical protein [Acidimicrobiia bacterium]